MTDAFPLTEILSTLRHVTDQDRDDPVERIMAMERQLMTLALRVDAIEGRSH